jgi:hypothetical protein
MLTWLRGDCLSGSVPLTALDVRFIVLKVKNPKAPAAKREAEEDCGSPYWIKNRKARAVKGEAEEDWDR